MTVSDVLQIPPSVLTEIPFHLESFSSRYCVKQYGTMNIYSAISPCSHSSVSSACFALLFLALVCGGAGGCGGVHWRRPQLLALGFLNFVFDGLDVQFAF